MLYFTTKCSFYDCINIYLGCYYNIGHYKTDKILGLIILIYMCIYVMRYFTTECSFSRCNCISIYLCCSQWFWNGWKNVGWNLIIYVMLCSGEFNGYVCFCGSWLPAFWAVQWSWFAWVNALCNLSRKKSREVAASLPGRFLRRCCFTLWITMEVEHRIAKQ